MVTFPIVMLPGWLLGSRRYEVLAQGFERKGYHTYIVDFPGFEQGIKLTRVLNLTDYVKHLQKFLRLQKIKKAIFICHSFGGRVALKLISQEPKLARALIISGTPGYPGITKLRFYLTLYIAKIGKIASWIPPFLFIRKLLKKLFYRITRASDYLHTKGFIRETFKNIINEHLVDYMGKIRVPTLLLWGEKDRLVPVKIARRMQVVIRGSQLVVVPGMGHMFTYREPENFTKYVLEFLDSL